MSLLESAKECPFCEGDGKCSICNGTGRNRNADEPESWCRRCSGTSTCSQCLGSGTARPLPPENLHSEIVQL